MYPGLHAVARADQPAVIMAGSGETVTYRELEARSNRLAHLLRAVGLKRLDHYAIFMENHPRYVECCAAGERSGLYFTYVNSFLTADELAYIVNNSLSKVLITSQAKREVALAALPRLPERRASASSSMDRARVSAFGISTRRRPNFLQRRSPTSRSANGDALFLGHDRQPEGRAAAAARSAAGATRFRSSIVFIENLAVSRGADLSLAGAALPFGALGRRQPHDQARRHAHRHGAFRRGAVSCISSRNIASPTPSSCRRCSRGC